MRVKPSIELPSNQVPFLSDPSSWWMGMVTPLTMPMMSVNWSSMKRMFRSLAASIFASGSAPTSINADSFAWSRAAPSCPSTPSPEV